MRSVGLGRETVEVGGYDAEGATLHTETEMSVEGVWDICPFQGSSVLD